VTAERDKTAGTAPLLVAVTQANCTRPPAASPESSPASVQGYTVALANDGSSSTATKVAFAILPILSQCPHRGGLVNVGERDCIALRDQIARVRFALPTASNQASRNLPHRGRAERGRGRSVDT
jgi:hypothetical protein